MSVASNTLVVTGAGLVSSLGADVSVACGAARAGLTRPADTDFTVEDPDSFAMAPVTGHPVGALTLGFSELGLWVRLGSMALGNLLARHPVDRDAWAKMALLINLPGDYYLRCSRELLRQRLDRSGQAPPPEGVPFPALIPWYRAEYARKLLASLDIDTPPALQELVFEDETGILTVLARAAQLLESGRVTRCLVGGIDSLLEPRWLDACDELRILKTAVRPVGFMPGEGAAFLLLEQQGHARRHGRTVLASVGGMSLQESAHRFSGTAPDGRALSESIRASLRHASGPCTAFYGDLNGDVARAQDWGMSQVRLRPEHARATLQVPAESFGYTRTAYGYLASCMALHAFARGHAPSETLLVWASSDSGARGSFTLTRPHSPEQV